MFSRIQRADSSAWWSVRLIIERSRVQLPFGPSTTRVHIPGRRSFEKIIIDRIKKICPTLERSNDTQFTENNIYIASYIFRKIFDSVSTGKTTIPLYIESSSKNKILWYEHAQGLAQGEEEAMEKLKGAIENLLIDKEIISRIKEYNDLMDKLNNDEQISKMHIVIREFHTRIHGGHVLGNLCLGRYIRRPYGTTISYSFSL